MSGDNTKSGTAREEEFHRAADRLKLVFPETSFSGCYDALKLKFDRVSETAALDFEVSQTTLRGTSSAKPKTGQVDKILWKLSKIAGTSSPQATLGEAIRIGAQCPQRILPLGLDRWKCLFRVGVSGLKHIAPRLEGLPHLVEDFIGQPDRPVIPLSWLRFKGKLLTFVERCR